ncbi:hypothetical protein HOP50_15g74210 [Chloropicon primus]|uniref:Uncharacterized protein n=1 Tax=Chloropicon primus TaxID=1764295 RepID=A0A5B8MVQ4_9CHLO|nr:hypothetical protein A3770_15p73960 [Chloropicon primus]UPR04088.1 hypothetical protein HOP50_15g74210 [Chloropicon primus]|eukprot:QDZ24878.1 hypothetical protein A3770_15p73960 [Chloropicon primus]
MRIDLTRASDKVGQRQARLDPQGVEAKVNKIGGLVKQLDDLNSLLRGRKGVGLQGGGDEAECLREELVEEISTELADVLSQLPPCFLLPDMKLKSFVGIARETGLLPLRRDFECCAPPTKVVAGSDSQKKEHKVSYAASKVGPASDKPIVQAEVHVGLLHQGMKRKREEAVGAADLRSAGRQETLTTTSQALGTKPQQGVMPSFSRTTHLPLIQRVMMNFAPKNAKVGLERDVTAKNLVDTLQDLALQPRSVVAGALPVNKTAVSLFYRIRESQLGRARDVYSEQIREMEREAVEEEERKLKLLDQSLPGHDQLAVMFRVAYHSKKKRNGYNMESLRAEFLQVLARLHPGDPGCSDCTLRLYMQGKYPSMAKRTKWRHAIFELCRECGEHGTAPPVKEKEKENTIPNMH